MRWKPLDSAEQQCDLNMVSMEPICLYLEKTKVTKGEKIDKLGYCNFLSRDNGAETEC